MTKAETVAGVAPVRAVDLAAQTERRGRTQKPSPAGPHGFPLSPSGERGLRRWIYRRIPRRAPFPALAAGGRAQCNTASCPLHPTGTGASNTRYLIKQTTRTERA